MSGTPSWASSTGWRGPVDGARSVGRGRQSGRHRAGRRAAADDHGRPRVGLLMTQNSGPTGSSRRTSIQGCSCSHAHSSMPTSRRRPPFPRRTGTAPRGRSRSDSLGASASWMRSPARQSTTISPRIRHPWRPSPAARMTATICSTARRIRRVAMPLVSWRTAGMESRQRRRRALATGGIKQSLGHDPSSGSNEMPAWRPADRHLHARLPVRRWSDMAPAVRGPLRCMGSEAVARR